MKDLIVQIFAKPVLKIGEGFLGGDIIRNTCIGSVGSTSVMVPQNLKKFIHVLMLVNIPEQLKKEKRRRIIILRSHVGRRTFDFVTVGSLRSDKGKIN